jgi:hypothetical protein
VTPEYDKPKLRFLGFLGSTCEHRTVGRRAWCLTCSEWCYPTSPCCRDERMMQMNQDDRVGTHFFGDGHDHGDPPPNSMLDPVIPPSIEQELARAFAALQAIKDAMVKHGLIRE